MVEQISWDDFYEKRMPAPFIVQNEMPDENLVEIVNSERIQTALELGCGEGRNAIYMASQGIEVTAIDISSVAIENAKKIAHQKGVSVNFLRVDALQYQSDTTYDLIYDSGMFHHLTPHRRITYVELVKGLLSHKGYFGLTCFAWGDYAVHGADEITDWEFYGRKCVGVAFTPERLREIFDAKLDMVSIRKMKDGIANTIQGLTFMWAALFKNRPCCVNSGPQQER